MARWLHYLTVLSKISWLVDVLRDCAGAGSTRQKKPLDNQVDEFTNYLEDLFNEKVLCSFPKGKKLYKNHKFHPDFIDETNDNRSHVGEKLRNKLINADNWKEWTWFTCNNIGPAQKKDSNKLESACLQDQETRNQEVKLKIVLSDDNQLGMLLRDTLIFNNKKSNGKSPTFYRIELIRWMDLHFIANVLLDCSESKEKDRRLDKQGGRFESYLAALFKENVLELVNNRIHFHKEFIEDTDAHRTEGLRVHREELRKILIKRMGKDNMKNCKFAIDDVTPFVKVNEFDGVVNRKLDDCIAKKDIDDFFQKLVFAVNMPNEDKLEGILKQAGNYFNLQDTELQFSNLYTDVVNWFKNHENTWLSSKKGNVISR